MCLMSCAFTLAHSHLFGLIIWSIGYYCQGLFPLTSTKTKKVQPFYQWNEATTWEIFQVIDDLIIFFFFCAVIVLNKFQQRLNVCFFRINFRRVEFCFQMKKSSFDAASKWILQVNFNHEQVCSLMKKLLDWLFKFRMNVFFCSFFCLFEKTEFRHLRASIYN